jgi:hypothetical protein
MRVLEEVCEMSLLEITQYFEVRGDAVNYNIIEEQDSNPAGQTSLITIRHLRVAKKITNITHPLNRTKRRAQDTSLSSHLSYSK